MDLMAEGKTNREIAEICGNSTRTVELHRARVFDKLNVSNAVELVRVIGTLAVMTRPLNRIYSSLADHRWFIRICVLLSSATVESGRAPADESAPPTQQVATGFFVSDAGYLVTAHHVIAGLTDIKRS